MRNTNKKGFTVVELVIVIAVIAILAAVLIPTISGIIKKANAANDTVVAKNMNTALAEYSALNGKPETFDEVLAAIEEAGYVLANLNAKAQGNLYGWDKTNNQIVYIDAEGKTIYQNVDFVAADLQFVVADSSVALPEGFKGNSIVDMTKPEGPKALKAALEEGKSVTLGADIALISTIVIPSDVTIDLAGHTLDASTITNRPFEVYDKASIVINATDAEIECAAFGLVDVKTGANCTLTINGGNFASDTDWGAVIKVRKNATANITLNNVNMKDSHTVTPEKYNTLIYNEGDLTLNIDGGVFEGNIGIAGATNVNIKNATFKTSGVAVYALNGTITNCTFEIGNWKENTTPTAAVAMSGDGVVEVNNCTITSAGMPAYRIYSGNGTIKATDCTVTGASDPVRHTNTGTIEIK